MSDDEEQRAKLRLPLEDVELVLVARPEGFEPPTF